jgi:hypothetical protein
MIALIEAARETLRERIAARLDGHDRYEALMVANVLAIAARHIESGGAAERAELAGLRALYDAPAGGLDELRARLSIELREAAPGSERLSRLFKHLNATAGA